MKRLNAVLLLSMIVALILSGCAPTAPAEPTEPTEAPTVAPAEETETEAGEETEAEGECVCGADITLGANGDAKIVNPILAMDSDGFWRTDLMFDSLVRVDPETLEVVGQLAESWEVSDDGTTYTFHLVDADVRWHDGEPFTVDDIEFTMMEILKPTYTGIFQERFVDLVGAQEMIAGEADDLEGFQVLDDSTVQFQLTRPNAPFLAWAVSALKFVPKHLLEGEEITEDMPYSLEPVGNGPYKFKEWEKGNRFVMERNEDYWGEEACAGTITSLAIPDMQALAAAVEAGDIDMTIMVPPTEIARLAETEGLTYFKQPAIGPESIYFNLDHPILQDIKVRTAIAHAIDAAGFTEGVLQGSTDPANTHFTSASWAYDPSATLPEYDVEKAKELLAEAGYEDGFEIRITTNQGNFFREQFVEFAQAELAKIGIDVQVDKAEWGTFIGNVMDHNFDMCFYNEEGGVPDPDVMYEYFHSTGPNNYTGYSKPEVDELLERGRVETDQDKRQDIYFEAQNILNDELPTIPMFWRPNPLVASDQFGNVEPSVIHTYGGIHKWCEMQ